MLPETEMYRRILGFAEARDDVRAVILNGSRANPTARPDPLRDFDIVYLVRDVAYYKEIPVQAVFGEAVFGPLLVWQRTDESELFGEHFPKTVSYLMQFADGNRIDLTLAAVEDFARFCFDDRLSVVLLDKDGALPELPPPNDSTHWVRLPTERIFTECRTEFWWVAPYVAKALWRGQVLLAEECLGAVRAMFRKMLEWRAASETGFSRSFGKAGDGLKDALPAPLWEAYRASFPPAEEDALWEALFSMCRSFSALTEDTARRFGFSVSDRFDRDVPRFLRYLRALPRDAETLDLSSPDPKGEPSC